MLAYKHTGIREASSRMCSCNKPRFTSTVLCAKARRSDRPRERVYDTSMKGTAVALREAGCEREGKGSQMEAIGKKTRCSPIYSHLLQSIFI